MSKHLTIFFLLFALIGCRQDDNNPGTCPMQDQLDLQLGNQSYADITVQSEADNFQGWASITTAGDTYHFISYVYYDNDRVFNVYIRFYLESPNDIQPGSYRIKESTPDGTGVEIEILDAEAFPQGFLVGSADASTYFEITEVKDQRACGSFRAYMSFFDEYLEGEFTLSFDEVEAVFPG